MKRSEVSPISIFGAFEAPFFQSRYFVFFISCVIYLTGCVLLRFFLFHQFSGDDFISLHAIFKIFSIGLRLDLAACFWLQLPLVLYLSFMPNKTFSSRWHRIIFSSALFVFMAFLFFVFKADYEFFDEFNAHFNTVAVDYLIYPREVFINLWQSYPLVRVVGGCIFGSFIIFFLFRQFKLSIWNPVSIQKRITFLIFYFIFGFLLVNSISIKNTRFGSNRVLSEISNNGEYSFVYSALTRNLDYPAFYPTINREEAFDRTRRLLEQPGITFHGEKESVQRFIPGDNNGKPKNLVILLIESFGSEFWGALGRAESLTPEMDQLSREGILFTNLYASGNRTVRGIEGVLSSFPPLPGDSIVKRDASENVSTLARVLKDKGYSTVYLYGGRGVFDGMKSFATKNGFDRFIEQKDFKDPVFTTIWGVADEILYQRAIEEFRASYDEKKPFFATVLSVSNHKPYTYPQGRIAENPDQHSRSHAVKYSDWALGDFFRRAKKEKFFKDTLFVVVADHGARVYGSQRIPIESYKIPMLIVGGPIHQSERVNVLGGSLDVGPTVLGLLGTSYESVFFGRNLFKTSDEKAWAVMHHNRDVGFYRNKKMVVMGLNKSIEFFEMDENGLREIPEKEGDPELKKDAISLFQVADDLYVSKRYVVQ